jgi:succinate dehydrogenase/fumarate reductase flavoprotein subunit
MLTVAYLATLGALAREESRGTHYRAEFPEAREAWRKHTVLAPTIEGHRVTRVTMKHEPVHTPSAVA